MFLASRFAERSASGQIGPIEHLFPPWGDADPGQAGITTIVGDTDHKIVIRDGSLLQEIGYCLFRYCRNITIPISRDQTDNHSRKLYGLLKLHRHLKAATHATTLWWK